MEKTEILVICRHEEILQTIMRLINTNPAWNATGVITDEDALSTFKEQPFRLVLLGSGIEAESEKTLCDKFKEQYPGVIIVQHYGGGSGLLAAESTRHWDNQMLKPSILKV